MSHDTRPLPPPARQPLKAEPFINQFIDDLRHQEVAELTMMSYWYDLVGFWRWFEETVGDAATPDAVTPTDIRDHRSHLVSIQKLQPSTVNRRLTALRRFFQWAKGRGFIKELPTENVKGVLSAPRSPHSLEKREVDRLIRTVERHGNKRDLAILLTLRHTGIRVSELCAAFPGRFVLGIGVSHRLVVEGMRGHAYGPPLAAMRAYLDAMDAAPYDPPREADEPRVLAALGPKMLELSRDRTAGAHPYLVPVEHTEQARQVLGQGPLLAPEQAVVLERDPDRAREIARVHMAVYLGLENYTNNLRRLGYGDDDLANGGSDRLVDAIVAWGSLDDVVARVRAHLAAGADHVCLQVLPSDPAGLPRREWRELAEALIG